MKQNVTNTIEVSSISEVQILNLMKNVANLVTELEINFGDLEDEDRRKKEVDIARELAQRNESTWSYARIRSGDQCKDKSRYN